MASANKTGKKSGKEAAKKPGALKLSSSKSTTMLMGADEAPSQFNGVIHYQAGGSFLVSGGSSLLVMYRPQGNYSPADIGAAASYLEHIVGKGEGNPATVLGYAAQLFGQACILMVAAS